eukprot:Mrub_04661.p1 GENE.Mrub_04661~~Mrub_04661.p1  ORF type:complete len:407 (+),score=62.19 Mrub_04661:56-1222(+)
MKKKFQKIYDDITFQTNSNASRSSFEFATAKDHTRAFVKILEDVTPNKKYPLEKLKDMARGSFTFEDPADLISFFEQFKSAITTTDGLRLLQIKNMFKEGCEDYQDIKMIVGYEYEGKVWPVEMQFLLKSIGDAKVALHYFYDITRADFTSMQASFYGRLMKYVESRGEAQEWDESSPFSLLLAQGRRLEDYVKSKIEKGNYVKTVEQDEDKSKKIYESENQYYQHDISKEREAIRYSAFQRGTKIENVEESSSSSYLTAKPQERKEILLYRGPPKEISKFQEIPLKVNEIGIKILKSIYGTVSIRKSAHLEGESLAYPVGKQLEYFKGKLTIDRTEIVFDSYKKKFKFYYITDTGKSPYEGMQPLSEAELNKKTKHFISEYNLYVYT